MMKQFRLPLPLLALGCWGLFGFHFCYFFAFQKAPAVEAFLLVELWPILIVLLAAPLAKERLLPHHMIAALLGFVGVVAIATAKGDFQGFSSDYALGYGLAIMAAITWAGYSVLSRRFAAQMSNNAIGVFCILSAVLSFISHGLFESWVSLTPLQWLGIVLMGIGPVGSAFFTWNTGMKHGNIALLGVLSLAIPLLGTLGLILGGHGSFTPAITLATGFILGAGLVGSGVWKRKKL
jgi:drug/metabolite transporter (DMT)-like permease